MRELYEMTFGGTPGESCGYPGVARLAARLHEAPADGVRLHLLELPADRPVRIEGAHPETFVVYEAVPPGAACTAEEAAAAALATAKSRAAEAGIPAGQAVAREVLSTPTVRREDCWPDAVSVKCAFDIPGTSEGGVVQTRVLHPDLVEEAREAGVGVAEYTHDEGKLSLQVGTMAMEPEGWTYARRSLLPLEAYRAEGQRTIYMATFFSEGMGSHADPWVWSELAPAR